MAEDIRSQCPEESREAIKTDFNQCFIDTIESLIPGQIGQADYRQTFNGTTDGLVVKLTRTHDQAEDKASIHIVDSEGVIVEAFSLDCATQQWQDRRQGESDSREIAFESAEPGLKTLQILQLGLENGVVELIETTI